ncbi:MAG: DUF6178 family protein [Desulfobacterales bacterium]|jgi:hypothetical protein|nr:DUF6178 family protein [Desulfobacterales bacterium]
MDENIENKKIVARIENLARQRKELLSLPPEEVLNSILNSTQSTALVHSFSEEDFYFLIHNIGIEDSHPLLYLASNKQWEYIVDLEVWEKDRIEFASITRWFDLLFKVDPNRFIKWSLDQKIEFMEFYLFKNIEVKIRETDQDPSELGDAFITLDDIFYVRFLDKPIAFESDGDESHETDKKHRDAFLSRYLKTLADNDHISYQNVLLESSGVIPAESEEEAYRLRNVRLAEKGFLPYEEAIGIYQPMKVRDFKIQENKFINQDLDQKLFFPVPLYHTGVIEEENHFTVALKNIKADDVLEQIQSEFAGLCNRIISADQKTIREKDELRSIVKKTSGYLNIGLEKLTEDNGERDTEHCTTLMQNYPLSSIFRVGFGLALELKWRAERWLKKSWFSSEGLLLGFWGEEWMGVLGGLLIKKPLFYDNYKTGELYREFISIDDIKKTDNILNEIIAFDELFSLISIEPDPAAKVYLTYKNFILTLWARHTLGLSEKLIPLTIDEFRGFFDDLWAGKEQPGKTSLSIKESFLDWVSSKTGLVHYEISQRLGQSFENIFSEIESEYGKVSRNDLDPRYIHLFLINIKKSGTKNE